MTKEKKQNKNIPLKSIYPFKLTLISILGTIIAIIIFIIIGVATSTWAFILVIIVAIWVSFSVIGFTFSMKVNYKYWLYHIILNLIPGVPIVTVFYNGIFNKVTEDILDLASYRFYYISF